MKRVMRACAVITGTVASAGVTLTVVWWFDPGFASRVAPSGVELVFGTGLLGFFLMFVLLVTEAVNRDNDLSLFLEYVPLRALALLPLVLVIAIVGAGIASARGAHWFASAPYSWHHCHWPLSANHGRVHRCVSHARWLGVKLETAHIFVGFGALFCTLDCLAFTVLSRVPRRSVQTLPPWPRIPDSG